MTESNIHIKKIPARYNSCCDDTFEDKYDVYKGKTRIARCNTEYEAKKIMYEIMGEEIAPNVYLINFE